jgi:hypothetical protein
VSPTVTNGRTPAGVSGSAATCVVIIPTRVMDPTTTETVYREDVDRGVVEALKSERTTTLGERLLRTPSRRLRFLARRGHLRRRRATAESNSTYTGARATASRVSTSHQFHRRSNTIVGLKRPTYPFKLSPI